MRTSNEQARRVPRRTRLAGRLLAVALLAAGVDACSDQPVESGAGRAVPAGPSLTLNPACDTALGGQIHWDSITSPETWSPAGNPHRVGMNIHITGAGVLTIQPGVLVCFAGHGRLYASGGGRLVADGLDTAGIVFTAADPAYGWEGVLLVGSPASPSSLRHVRIEHTRSSSALVTYDNHAAHVDSVVFRQNDRAAYLWGRGTRVSRSRVDTTTLSGYPAVEIGTLVTWERNVIRGAADIGLAVGGVHGVSLLGGRIEGSGGVGLLVITTGPGFVDTDPVRVVGGAGYPAELVVSAFPRIYPALADQDSLLGNARDTLVVRGGILQAFAYPTQALPWRVTGDITVQHYGILRAGPGASLTFTQGRYIRAHSGGRVVARGTQAAPVRFTAADSLGWWGIWLEDAPSLPSYLTNVRVEHMTAIAPAGVFAQDSHTLVIDSAVFRQNGSAVALGSPGSRISRSRVDTTYYGVGVHLASDARIESTLIRGAASLGLRVYTATAQVVSCEIRGSGWEGIRLEAAAAVHDCNLVDNGGAGIASTASSTADVESNWWGDAAGPTGPNGDGASGLLDYTPWRTTPFVLPYVP